MNKILNGIVKFSKNGVKGYLESIKQVENSGGAHSVMITCVDSRLCPSSFTQNGPGSFFMLKNAGNFVPQIDQFLLSYASIINPVPAVLDLTCNRIGIRNVIVCGHSDCRALAMLHDKFMSSKEDALIPDLNSPLDAWVCCHGKLTVEKHFHTGDLESSSIFTFNKDTPQEFQAIIDQDNKYDTLDRWSQVNVLEQVCHLQTYPMIARAKQKISLHALWLDLSRGEVLMFQPDHKRYLPVNESTLENLLKAPSF